MILTFKLEIFGIYHINTVLTRSFYYQKSLYIRPNELNVRKNEQITGLRLAAFFIRDCRSIYLETFYRHEGK